MSFSLFQEKGGGQNRKYINFDIDRQYFHHILQEKNSS